MSKIYDKYQTTQSVGGWYLRLNDGSVLGPVDLCVLQSWAVDGRVGPGNDVSQDMKTWEEANSLPELKMEWFADRDGEEYGPFNALATGNLVKRGVLDPSCELRHSETGRTVYARELLDWDAEAGEAGEESVDGAATTEDVWEYVVRRRERTWQGGGQSQPDPVVDIPPTVELIEPVEPVDEAVPETPPSDASPGRMEEQLREFAGEIEAMKKGLQNVTADLEKSRAEENRLQAIEKELEQSRGQLKRQRESITKLKKAREKVDREQAKQLAGTGDKLAAEIDEVERRRSKGVAELVESISLLAKHVENIEETSRRQAGSWQAAANEHGKTLSKFAENVKNIEETCLKRFMTLQKTWNDRAEFIKNVSEVESGKLAERIDALNTEIDENSSLVAEMLKKEVDMAVKFNSRLVLLEKAAHSAAQLMDTLREEMETYRWEYYNRERQAASTEEQPGQTQLF